MCVLHPEGTIPCVVDGAIAKLQMLLTDLQLREYLLHADVQDQLLLPLTIDIEVEEERVLQLDLSLMRVLRVIAHRLESVIGTEMDVLLRHPTTTIDLDRHLRVGFEATLLRLATNHLLKPLNANLIRRQHLPIHLHRLVGSLTNNTLPILLDRSVIHQVSIITFQMP